MANTENLIPIEEVNARKTREERSESARKAGIASGKARRRKKTTGELAKIMLQSSAPEKIASQVKNLYSDLEDADITNDAARLAGVVKRATQGYAKENVYLDELIAKAEQQEAENSVKWQMPITDLTSDFVEAYRAIHKAYDYGTYRRIISKGGRGSIKSSFWSDVAEETIYNDKQAHVVFTRRYKVDLKDSVYNQFIKTVTRHNKADEWEFSKSPLMARYKPTGQTVMFVGCDKPVSLKSYNVTFGYVKLMISEECDEMAGIEQIESVEDTFLRGNVNAVSVLVYNPPKSVNNWMNEYTEEQKQEPTTFITHSYYYNVPVEWLGKRFFERAEWFKVNKPTYYKNNYLGEVTGTGGTVFENLEFRTLSDAEINAQSYRYYGLDFGYEHPQAFIECAFDDETDTVYVINEVRKVRTKQEQFARLLKDYKNKEIKADSADPEKIDDWQDYGFDVIGATKYWKGGGRDYSWEWLQTRAKIVIDEARTPFIAKEMKTAEFEQLRDGSFSSQYPRLNEDCIMALIYSLNDVIRSEKRLADYEEDY